MSALWTASRRRAWARFLANRGAVAGAALLLVFLAVAALAPWLSPQGPEAQALALRLQAPSWAHLLGTDDLGRDLLSRLLHGARTSLEVGVLAVGAALSLGLPLGLAAGMLGGWVDGLLMRTLDVLLAFPGILLALLVVAILGPSLEHAILAIAVVNVPHYARLMRASAMATVRMEFVEAARATGAGPWRVALGHLLPNAVGPLVVQATLGFGTAVLEAAGLGFLGLGAQPPTPEWGTMLADARPYLREAWWLVAFPGLAISATVVGFNLLGDGLRDMLDPQGSRG